jgi:hypothetical protein
MTLVVPRLAGELGRVHGIEPLSQQCPPSPRLWPRLTQSSSVSPGTPLHAESQGLLVNPVDTDGVIVEHGSALCSRVTFGQPFEGVVHDIVGVRHLVDREVAFEHAAVGTELLDTVMHQGGQRCSELF